MRPTDCNLGLSHSPDMNTTLDSTDALQDRQQLSVASQPMDLFFRLLLQRADHFQRVGK